MEAIRPCLMVVVSDLVTLDQLMEGFQTHEPGIEVIPAESAAKALDLANEHVPDALIVDMELRDMEGADFVNTMRRRYPAAIFMVLNEPYTSGAHKGSRNLSEAHCFDKPIDFRELIKYVSSLMLGEEVGFSGMLDNLELPDILQLLCCRNDTVHLRISSDWDVGHIYIKEGNLVHAQNSEWEGEEAFYNLFTWKAGSFEMLDGKEAPKQTIHTPWQALLLEAGRLLDERGDVPESRAQAARPRLSSKQPRPAQVASRFNVAKALTNKERRSTNLTTPVAGIITAPEEPHEVETQQRSSAAIRPAPIDTTDESVLQHQPLYKANETHAGTEPGTDVAGKAPSKKSQELLTKVAAIGILVLGVMCSYLVWRIVQHSITPVGVVSVLVKPPAQASPLKIPDLPTLWSPAAESSVSGAGIPVTCALKILQLKAFSRSGIVVGLDSETFDEMGLGEHPWIKLIGREGTYIGAYATSREVPHRTVVIRLSMAEALRLSAKESPLVKVEPIRWSRGHINRDPLTFTRSRKLPSQYSDYWFAVGLSIGAMNKAGLYPGAYAIVKGPKGYQSVEVQLMDRGQPLEIWLSRPVRDAIGEIKRDLDEITLFPRTGDEADVDRVNGPGMKWVTMVNTP